LSNEYARTVEDLWRIVAAGDPWKAAPHQRDGKSVALTFFHIDRRSAMHACLGHQSRMLGPANDVGFASWQ